ncbi:MAG: hypothetical protein LQ338_008264 [Usnochroma carphineum]|nr:MAG: hypothetical protein LQ338_008264 [Usnochroma carphineum]
MDQRPDYSDWSSQRLVERVTLLEKQLREQTERLALSLYSDASHISDTSSRYDQLSKASSPDRKPKKVKAVRQFDPSKYSTRFIALKFAYLGQQYNGLEYHANNTTPYSTIEEELWKALSKAKLIFPTPNPSLQDGELNWKGCEYSKCGRTDKGVSAFGQVISLRVRSNRPLPKSESDEAPAAEDDERDNHVDVPDDGIAQFRENIFDPIKDEIPYSQILNRLLPPEIRILAWCPFPPAEFSARFSCTERCYKYFFTQPAFAPTPGPAGFSSAEDSRGQRREGWLDIHAMREAARKFEGSHDFRNFCKVDPSKQIDNFRRLVNQSDIVEVKPERKGPVGYLGLPEFQEHHPAPVPPIQNLSNTHDSKETQVCEAQSTPTIYAFEVRGSGFLWHQVRHMVAVLFLVGQGLEKPSLIDNLLDSEKTPQKPLYDMADAAPLVLEDCKFGPGLGWVYIGDYAGEGAGITRTAGKGNGKYGIGGAVDELWKVWRRHKIDETLAGSLLDLAVRGYEDNKPLGQVRGEKESAVTVKRKGGSQRIFIGGDSPRHVGQYTPVLERPRMETVDEVNSKYLKRKGLDPQERNGIKAVDAADDG